MSSNFNPLYVQYVPLICKAWNNWGYNVILTLVTDRPKEEWEWMEEYATIRHYEPHPDIDEGIYSKVARFFSYYQEEGINMVSDIDMLPLNKEYFDNLFKQLIEPIPGGYGYSIKDKFVSASHDAYLNAVNSWAGPIEFLKFPGCYMLASNKMWQKIINPYNKTEEELLQEWSQLERFDSKESIKNHYNNFSEESLIRCLYYSYDPRSEKIIKLQRGWNPQAERRIDRDNWDLNISKLHSDYYIDSHLPRPLATNRDKFPHLLEYLNLDEELIEIGINKTK